MEPADLDSAKAAQYTHLISAYPKQSGMDSLLFGILGFSSVLSRPLNRSDRWRRSTDRVIV